MIADSSGDTLVAEGNATTQVQVVGYTVVSLRIPSAGRYILAFYMHSAGALGALRFDTGESDKNKVLAFTIEWGGANAWMFNPIPLIHTFATASTITIKVVNGITSTYFAGIFATPS